MRLILGETLMLTFVHMLVRDTKGMVPLPNKDQKIVYYNLFYNNNIYVMVSYMCILLYMIQL